MCYGRRIGVLIRSYLVCDYEYRIIKSIYSNKNIKEIIFILADDVELAPSKKNLWGFYDKCYLSKNTKTAFQKDMSSLIEEGVCIRGRLKKKGAFSFDLDDESIEKIKEKDFHFIVNFQYKILTGEILKSSKIGVVSLHHGDTRRFRGGPAGFWEVYKGEPTCGITIQILTDSLDDGDIIAEAKIKSNERSLSKTRDMLYNTSVCLYENALYKLLRGEPPIIKKESKKGKLYRAPGNMVMIFYFFKIFIRGLKSFFNSAVFYEEWTIGKGSLCLNSLFDVDEIKPMWLQPDKWPFFKADPFWLNKNEFLFESFNYNTGKGVIKKGSFIQDRTLIEPFYESASHLSYPYVFKVQDEKYLIIETHQEKSLFAIELDENDRPRKKIKLIDGVPLCDSSIVFYKGLFWVFATVKNDFQDANTNLYLYYSESFSGPYSSHLANPVVSDVSSARPAGCMFQKDGELYRFSQDCSNTYGGGLNLLKVKKLNEKEYEQEIISAIKPIYPYTEGIHHMDFWDGQYLLDGKRRRVKPFLSWFKGIDEEKPLLDKMPSYYTYIPHMTEMKFCQVSGMYSDMWLKRKSRIIVNLSFPYSVSIFIDSPGWHIKKNKVRIKVENHVIYKSSVIAGEQKIELPEIDHPSGYVTIDISFGNEKKISLEDSRKASAILKKVTFEKCTGIDQK